MGDPRQLECPRRAFDCDIANAERGRIDTRPAWHTGMPWRPRLSARLPADVIGRRPPRPRPLDSIPGSGFRPGTVAAIETTNAEPQGFIGGRRPASASAALPPAGTGAGGKDAA